MIAHKKEAYMPQDIKEIIREKRKKQKMSQEDLGIVIGVRKGVVSDWETGRTELGYMQLVAIAKALRIDHEVILESTGVDITPSLEVNLDDNSTLADHVPVKTSDLEAMKSIAEALGGRLTFGLLKSLLSIRLTG